jgi:TonB family protein
MRLYRSAVRLGLSVLILASSVTAPLLAEQDALQVIKDLYASANYEEALSAIAKLDPSTPNLEAEQYRVFCLVALGRMDDADKAVEAVLTAHPEYRPDAAQASPRIQALFSQVRKRIGPALVKQMYQQGKAAMDRKDREEAVRQFEAMLRIADDADVRGEAGVAELRELGAGFLELSRATPPKNASPDPAVPSGTAPAGGSPTSGSSPPAPGGIVAPVVVQQRFPQWVPPDAAARVRAFRGSVRVQISAEGKVTSAEIVKSVHPAYDPLLLRAARSWLYEPARQDGVAISSEKTVEVAIGPPGK